jgi:hypothetical protein
VLNQIYYQYTVSWPLIQPARQWATDRTLSWWSPPPHYVIDAWGPRMTLVYLVFAFVAGILAGISPRGGVLSCGTPSWCLPLPSCSSSQPSCSCANAFRTPGCSAWPVRASSAAVRGRSVRALLVWLTWRPITRARMAFGRRWEGVAIGYPMYVTADAVPVGCRTCRDRRAAARVKGRTLIEAPRQPLYAYGDRLAVSGVLLSPPIFDDFNYAVISPRNIHASSGVRTSSAWNPAGTGFLAGAVRVRTGHPAF